MALSDIAAGLEVTTEQRDRGVAAVDDTDASLAERLRPFEADLPCTAEAAATVLEANTAGTAIGESAREAGVSPVTAAKALHLLGVEGVCPLGPTGRDVVRDWLDARLPRSEARTLADASEREFALAVFVETHDPLSGAAERVEGALTPDRNATVEKCERLAETMSDVGDLL